jgi:hypothetical protein
MGAWRVHGGSGQEFCERKIDLLLSERSDDAGAAIVY